MGACDFYHVQPGAAGPRKAFDAAVSQAQYDFGHAGYTGSIAEKDDFVVISDHVFSSQEEAMERAGRLMNDDDPRISDKWGPAGAMSFLNAKGEICWLFFGWASS